MTLDQYQNPAVSCKKIAELRPNYDSGYYWIQGTSGVVKVYCEIGTNNTFGESGGWMRIANVDMRNHQSQCSPGLVYNVTEERRLCHKPNLAPECSSTTFSTYGVTHEKICGKVIGYQYFQPNGFGPSRNSPEISQTYVDGISITHGSPQQHVWTLAAACSETESILAVYVFPLYTRFMDLSPALLLMTTTVKLAAEQHLNLITLYYFDDPLWDALSLPVARIRYMVHTKDLKFYPY